jgi:hypothetical protein
MNVNVKRKQRGVGLGKNQQKVLLLLLSGVALAFVRTPTGYRRLAEGLSREWQAIDRAYLYRTIASLYQSRLIRARDQADGSTTMVLTEKGKERALRYNIDEMRVKAPARWDGKWRVVTFDIPEKKKKAREAFRATLKQLGFQEFHKSVFVLPYPCDDEVDFVVEFFSLRPYVRMILAEKIDNQVHLRERFGLP